MQLSQLIVDHRHAGVAGRHCFFQCLFRWESWQGYRLLLAGQLPLDVREPFVGPLQGIVQGSLQISKDGCVIQHAMGDTIGTSLREGQFSVDAASCRVCLELFEKRQVVAPEVADVVDTMQEHGNPLGPEAKGEACVTVGIVATVL